MARLKKNPYPQASLEDLHNPAVLVVDMINGFIREGALADPAIAQVEKPIENLLQQIDDALFITDSHEPGCLEFDAFPPHCQSDSSESEVVDSLQPYVRQTLKKNAVNTFSAPGFVEWVEAGPQERDFVITGCCTDLCVLQLALSLQSWIHQHNKTGMRVFLPVDCVDTYDIPELHDAQEWNDFSLRNMAANGIHVVSTIQ